MKQSNWFWIVLIALLLLLFSGEIFALIGAVLGLLFSLGIAGLVLVLIAAFAFGIVVFIGGSVALAGLIALIAVTAVLFSWFWPFLLVGLIIYLLVRKKPKAV